MAGKKLLKLEYTVTIIIIAAIIILILPFDFSSNAQANFISRWCDKYSRLEYMFSVINAHESEEILKNLKNAPDAKTREQILIRVIQPYFRIHKEKLPKRYSTKFMNNTKVPRSSRYYFDDTYFSENGMIVGIKDLKKTNAQEPMFIMMFDINGILPPNTWGRDIYGVNIYEDKIEPFGAEQPMAELKTDCSAFGTGVGCSYYYKIGGGFND